MKNANKLVYLSLLLFLAFTVILAFLNRGDVELGRALAENREFQIRINGEYVATVNFHMLLELDPQEFTTPFATSITAPRDVSLRGVELRSLLEAVNIDASEASHFVVSGIDGYHSPLTRDEVVREGLIYICFEMDGEILKPRNEGGFGPYLMVIRGSAFAQRWCKYVHVIDVII